MENKINHDQIKQSSNLSRYSEDEVKNILHARAERLAKIKTTPAHNQTEVKVLVFYLNNERYGILSNFVKSTNKIIYITKLPSVPDFVSGIMNIHGDIVCVIDLKKYIGLPSAPNSKDCRIILVAYNKMEIGFIVDSLVGIQNVNHAELQPYFSSTLLNDQYIQFITHDQLAILNIPNIITPEKIDINQFV